MKMYLAGEHDVKNGLARITGGGWKDLCVLESFFYARKNQYFEELYSREVDLLLDSGAFTFMNNATGAIDWDGYIEEYAAFINSHGITKFFELDIDSIVGIKEVERLRAKLEAKTGRRCIPVWHVSRGLEYFKRLVRDYDYIAIGGYVTKEIERAAYEKAFPFLIKTAHDSGCKIHGLGYTNLEGLKKYKFDSVDSTAWISGNRFGAVYKFDPKEGTMKKWNKPSGMRVKNMETAFNNFFEWVKFQQYLKLRR